MNAENKLKIIFQLLVVIVIVYITIDVLSVTQFSHFKYLYKKPVGVKYVYRIHENKIISAVVSKSKEGADEIAKVINSNGKDSFNFNRMKIGTFISCSTKIVLIDTIRINDVLFAIIKNSYGTGRLAVTEYLYVSDRFLFDDVIGECPETSR